MIPAPPPRLDTSSFTLRPWSASDAPALASVLAASDAHLRAWTPWVVDGRVPGQTLAERLERHEQAFESGTEWVYGIFNPTGNVLGGCGLYPRVGNGAIEIGYWLSLAQTGRGLATAATAQLTRLAFAAKDIDRIEIRCATDNVASGRVPERLGYHIQEQVAAAPNSGHAETLVVWEMTRAEWSTFDPERWPIGGRV
ncbi:MAG TPA: GNAT family N-acetyltransferase [Gemmatimonadaceae bacterium]|nr:GNAT family N-acetyltransferase [Gemmatimonadaceae bacterium]